MRNVRYKHPIRFYFLATFFPWLFWFVAAYLSHIEPTNHFYTLMYGALGVVGLLSPAVVAFVMMVIDPLLRKDL